MNKKQIRKEFRRVCLERDKNKCRVCKAGGELDVHHITDRNEMPNGGYTLDNGISLCAACHLKAEAFHMSAGKSWEPGFHPDDLYRLIK